MIELAHRSGEIESIEAHVVYENDEFHFEYGKHPDIVHKPTLTNKGEPIAYYATYHTKNGGFGFEVMSIEDVKEFANKYSQAYKNGRNSPWATDFNAMAMKGLALNTPIPTIDGWKNMEDIEIGDTVFDIDGNPTSVIAVSEIKHKPCYEVVFSDGGSIVCDDEHLWLSRYGFNAQREVREKGWATHTAKFLQEVKQQGKTVKVPVSPSLNLEEKDLKIDPWLLGYWLGNGSSWSANVTCDVKDADHIKKKISETKYSLGSVRKDPRNNSVNIGIRDGFKVDLKEMGLIRNKHIPIEYLRASKEQRIALLRGLMDSDGTIEKSRGRALFCNTDKELIDSVLELVRSLGEQAHTICTKAKGYGKVVDLYSIEWLPAHFNPATLPRKAEIVRDRIVDNYRSVKEIKTVDSVPTKCIAVDSPTHSYLCGIQLIPTHNTVLKQVLKYAPLKTEFAREVATDSTIKSYPIEKIEDDEDVNIIDLPSEDYNVELAIDPDTGEVGLPLEDNGKSN